MVDFFIRAFVVFLYQPLFNALVLLYVVLPWRDFGLAVIVLTLLIRLVLYPLTLQGIKSQRDLQRIQPKIKEVQNKFKKDKEKQARAVMELYRKERINPLAGIIPLLIQLPILFALFQVFWRGFAPDRLERYLYPFISNPGQIDTSFLGVVDLAQPVLLLAVITGIIQFFQTKMITPHQSKHGAGQAPDFSSLMQKQMLYFFPIFTVLILWRLPSAIALYWLTTTLFTIFQQFVILRKHDQSQPTPTN